MKRITYLLGEILFWFSLGYWILSIVTFLLSALDASCIFELPFGNSLVVDSKGKIYVFIPMAYRIQMYSPEGKYSGCIQLKKLGIPHKGNIFISIDDEDILYIGGIPGIYSVSQNEVKLEY